MLKRFSLCLLLSALSVHAEVTPPLPESCVERVRCATVVEGQAKVLRQELDLRDGGGILRAFRRDIALPGVESERAASVECRNLSQKLTRTPRCTSQWDELKAGEEQSTGELRRRAWENIVLVAEDYDTLDQLAHSDDFPFPIVPRLPQSLIQSWNDFEDARLKNLHKLPFAYARFLERMGEARPAALFLDAVMYGEDPYASQWLEASLSRLRREGHFPVKAGTTADESQIFIRHLQPVSVMLGVGFDSDGKIGRAYYRCEKKGQPSGWTMKVSTQEEPNRYRPFVYPYHCPSASSFEVELARTSGYEIPVWKREKTPLVYKTGEVTLGLHVPYMDEGKTSLPIYPLLKVNRPDFDLHAFDGKTVILGSLVAMSGTDAHDVENQTMNGVMVILSATRAMLQPEIWESIRDTGMQLRAAE